MGNHPSAQKRHRQSLRRRDRNRATKSLCRTAAKKTASAVAGADIKSAQESLRETEKALASAAAKGVYHKKNASRRVSRLAKMVNKAAKEKK
jgi:small subunit ribosomal protein S20